MYLYTDEPIEYGDDSAGVDPSNYQNNNFAYSTVQPNINAVLADSGYYDYYGCQFDNDYQGFDCGYAVVVMQAYFLAPSTGSYTFNTPTGVDNQEIVWTGNIAYGQSPWSTSNANYNVIRAGSGPYIEGGAYTVQLNAGDLLPFSTMWVNGGGPGQAQVTITDPAGVQHSDTTGFFVTPCSDDNAFQP